MLEMPVAPASKVEPTAEPVAAEELELLETIAMLQAHLDALALTNTCLHTQLDNAKNCAVEVEQRVKGGHARDSDDERPNRRVRRGRDDDIADNGDSDELPCAVHRGYSLGESSAGSSVLTSSITSLPTTDVEVNDQPRVYRSSSAAADAEFDDALLDEGDADGMAVTYRSCGGALGSGDDLLAAAFDLDVLKEAVNGLGALRQGGAPPADDAVAQQLARLEAAMRAYRL